MSEQRIPILFVIDQLRIGGAERQLVELLKGIDKRRFRPFLFCTVAGGHWQETCERYGIPVFVHRKDRWGRFAAIREIIRMVRRHRIRIVHSWLWYSNLLCFAATRFSHAPLWLLSVRGIYLGFTGLHLLAERFANRFVDHITTVSAFNRRVLRDMHGVALRKVSVIYNGIDPSPFQVALPEDDGFAEGLGASDPLLGCVANFSVEKGHRYLLKAMPEVLRRFPKMRLLLVGDGPLRPSIEARVKALGLSDCVRLLGVRTDVPGILSVLHLLVLPSVLEGTPNVVLEAMAAGVPVVTTRVGGIPELVEEKVTGLLVPPRDPQALAEAILWMLEHPERRGRIGEVGRHRVKALFGLRRMVRCYEDLYFRMLGTPNFDAER